MNLILIFFLSLASIYDLRYRIIPNYISLLILLTGFVNKEVYFSGLLVSVLIFIVCIFYNEDYKGGGDIKLIGAIGLVLGFFEAFYIFCISEILVLFFRIIYVRTKRKEIKEVAYAPFILISKIILNII